MSSYVIAPVNYALLGLLVLAALASLAIGLRRQWTRVAAGATPDSQLSSQPLRDRINWRALGLRGALTSRLFKRPVAGSAHAFLFFGALVEISGHAVVSLGVLGIDTYQGAFGFLFMQLGRELAGTSMLLGAVCV